MRELLRIGSFDFVKQRHLVHYVRHLGHPTLTTGRGKNNRHLMPFPRQGVTKNMDALLRVGPITIVREKNTGLAERNKCLAIGDSAHADGARCKFSDYTRVASFRSLPSAINLRVASLASRAFAYEVFGNVPIASRRSTPPVRYFKRQRFAPLRSISKIRRHRNIFRKSPLASRARAKVCWVNS